MKRLLLVMLLCLALPLAAQVMKGHGAPTVNTPSSADNRFYLDVETGLLYVSADGKTWEKASVATSLPGVSSNGSNGLLTKSDPYNVKAYGAKGDGTTDDSAAIQTAITAASATCGTVYFPGAAYKMKSAVTMATCVTLRGDAPALTPQSAEISDMDLYMAVAGGTWLDCNAGTCITGSVLNNITMEKLGFKNFSKAVTFGGDGITGITFSRLNHLIFIGNLTPNSADVGMEIYNFQHIQGNFLSFSDVNTGLHLISQIYQQGPGNSVFEDYYAKTYDKSAALGNAAKPGLWLEIKQPTVGNPSQLNYVKFGRTQVNTFQRGQSDGTGVGIGIYGIGTTGVHGVVINGIDVEGELGRSVDTFNMTNSELYFSGAVLTTPTGHYGLYLGGTSDFNILHSIHDQVSVYNTSASNLFYGHFKSVQTGGVMRGFYNVPGGKAVTMQGETATIGQLDVDNLATATESGNQNGYEFNFKSHYWDGAASQEDKWTWKTTFNPSAGANPAVTLGLTHTGTSGTTALSMPFLTKFGGTTQINADGSAQFSGSVNLNAASFVNGADWWFRNQTAADATHNRLSSIQYVSSYFWNGSASTMAKWALYQTFSPTNTTATKAIYYLDYQDGGLSGYVKVPALLLKSTTADTCDATNAGAMQYTAGGAGAKDVVQVCAKDAANAYAWRAIY